MADALELPLLYTEFADWYYLLTAPGDYEEEAAIFTRLIETSARREVRTVLELGAGGGANASYMKARFEMTLTDLSEAMLAQSRTLNPELEHVQGDMRSLRLGRDFDAVFVHDAVDYMLTEDDVAAAIATAYVHLRPGGVALFVPDVVRETFAEDALTGGHDGTDGRALRYLEWQFDPDPADTTYITTFTYVLREGAETRAVHDVHTCGMFPRQTWLRLLSEAGFAAFTTNEPHSEVEAGIEVFVAVRPE
ncbi:MAG: class I SAM-dependent methyltransferase [Dehalococcoidia bacterium]|nr:class I SAM-dependent methyltransferase [Dehalococcoidia bacterium]